MPDFPPSRFPRRLLPDCEEVHHLTMKSLDLPLSWTERLRMRSHLAICDACTRFSAQMRTLREAVHRLGRDS